MYTDSMKKLRSSHLSKLSCVRIPPSYSIISLLSAFPLSHKDVLPDFDIAAPKPKSSLLTFLKTSVSCEEILRLGSTLMKSGSESLNPATYLIKRTIVTP